VILGTQFYKPKDFASQINLNVNNMWGILKTVVDMCMKLGDGKYLLVKDPNKPLIRLYEVPMDAFDQDFAEETITEEVRKPLFAPLFAFKRRVQGKGVHSASTWRVVALHQSA
jgi:translation initiation factor 3 subunit D